jgi:hypothetical protein
MSKRKTVQRPPVSARQHAKKPKLVESESSGEEQFIEDDDEDLMARAAEMMDFGDDQDDDSDSGGSSGSGNDAQEADSAEGSEEEDDDHLSLVDSSRPQTTNGAIKDQTTSGPRGQKDTVSRINLPSKKSFKFDCSSACHDIVHRARAATVFVSLKARPRPCRQPQEDVVPNSDCAGCRCACSSGSYKERRRRYSLPRNSHEIKRRQLETVF